MSNVVLNNLIKSYDGKKNIINNINLEIQDKEFIVLVGSSGCGKSTILRLIAGLEEITNGKIYIDNVLMNNILPKDRDIALVFQSYALYPHMSVYDNIAFGLKMRKFNKETIDEKVKEAAKILNLEDLLDRKPKQLSGGQRQRVALGRAIVRNPKVFLMDEPLSNLDANLRLQMRTEIKRLHKNLATTFIYVTHDQTEALTMGDRIVVLDKGIIQQVDKPEIIYNNPKNKFVAGFFGQMNFIDIEVIDNVFKIENIEFELPPNISNKEIIVGIRSEKMLTGSKNINANIDIIEMTGGEKNIYFELNGAKCCAKAPIDFKSEDNIELKLDIKDMYFFDKNTGVNLLYC